MAIADILAEKEELEQKYLEKIVKLSHADQVLELLGRWLHDFTYFPGFFDPYHGVYDRFADEVEVEITYGAAYGYRILLPRIGKKSLLMIMITILGMLLMMLPKFMRWL